MERDALRRRLFVLGLVAAAARLGVSRSASTRARRSTCRRTACARSTPTPRTTCAARASPSSSFPRTILFDPLMNFPEGGVADLASALRPRAGRCPRGSRTAPTRPRARSWRGAPRGSPSRSRPARSLLAGLLGRRLYGRAAGGRGRALSRGLPRPHPLVAVRAHATSTSPNRSAGLLALVALPREPREARLRRQRRCARPPRALALALAVLTWQGAIYWGAIFALALFLEAVARAPLRRCAPPSGRSALPAVVAGAATAAWLGWLRPPLTYVSFGFFQPLFLAALCGGTAAARASRSRAARRRVDAPGDRRHARRRRRSRPPRTLPFARELSRGPRQRRGLRGGNDARGRRRPAGYVSYPDGLAEGHLRGAAAARRRPRRSRSQQLSAGFFLAAARRARLGRARAARRAPRRPRRARHLGSRDALPRALAAAERLLRGAARGARRSLETVRFVRGAARGGDGRAGCRAAARRDRGLVLLSRWRRACATSSRDAYVPGSDLFDTLDWMRAELPHAIDAYDPRPARSAALPRRRSRGRPSVLAPWSLGHFLLYEAELPGRREQLRLRLPRLDPLLPRRNARRRPSRSRGATACAGSSRRTSCRA